MTFQAPKGTFDLIPENEKELWKSTYLWNHVETVLRDCAETFGFSEIRTPIFERNELFCKTVGEETDIVCKEMYTFLDRADRLMTLRPEGTCPALRAIIEHNLTRSKGVQKFYYLSPMFRYERNQAGRYRQHHQFGAEVVGIKNPLADCELIDFLLTAYKKLGINNVTLNINSLGSENERKLYKEALVAFLMEKQDHLSPDSQERLKKNPLRILDSKEAKDIEILEKAPKLLEFLSPESRVYFEAVQKHLTTLSIPFVVNPFLVRGLDYYNEVVFEVTTDDLGAQNSIGGGGRYDGLMKRLGGPDLPSLGFGTGIERIIQTMIKQNSSLPTPSHPMLTLIPLGEQGEMVCFKKAHELRELGISVVLDYTEKKVGKKIEEALNVQSSFIAVIGDEEIEKGEVALRHLKSKESFPIPLKSLAAIMQFEKKSSLFIELWQEMDQPFQNERERDFFAGRISQSITSNEKISTNLQTAIHEIKQLL